MTDKPERVVRYGLTTVVLGESFHARSGGFSQAVRDAWWQRKDYAWQCDIDSDASDGYPTLALALSGARTHLFAHPGATVREVT